MKSLKVHSVVCAIALLCSASCYAQSTKPTAPSIVSIAPADAASTITDAQWQRLSAHPRLFSDAKRFAVVEAQSDPVSKKLMALLRKDADKALAAKPMVYPTSGFLMGPMRQVQGRILTLSMMYRLTGEKRYFDRARLELIQMADLPTWNPSHFLDVGEASLAAGIGLDWLYDDLSPSDRDKITQGIKNNALLPSLEQDEKENNGSWVNGDFNWNPVCHGGLMVGALAIAEREPELSKKIIERAIKNLPYAEAAYAPDGSDPEGPSYWSYGTSFYVLAVEALRSALGTSYGLGTSRGFLRTAEFNLQINGPSGQEYNFSDYHPENLQEPVMLWFARELHRYDLADGELKNIALMDDAAKSGSDSPINQSRHLAFELLWWDSALADTHQQLPLHWTASGTLPIAVLRSAWNDSKATYLAIKGGTPNYSHAHMDVGSFILEADGVRWALDLGTENYNLMRAAKLDLWNTTQNSNRWTTFRVGPEGHNILRFNGERQLIAGKGEVSALTLKNGDIGDVMDLASLYKNQAENVERRVTLHPDRSVTIEDKWTAGSQPVEVAWQWLTRATVTRTERGLLLTQQGHTLELVAASPSAFETEIQDVSQSKATQDSPNPGVTRIVIKLKTNANQSGRLVVQAIPNSPR